MINMFRVSSLTVLGLACLAEARNTPFFGKKEYTPLVYFTVPKGLIPENDAMEKAVKQVEKELGVKVERLDILRNPAAEGAMAVLTSKAPPFLYHRESCQTIHLPSAATGGGGSAAAADASSASMPTHVDMDRLRAWAKGRHLAPQVTKAKVKPPQVITQDGTAIDQEELLEDMTLTPLQRKGKEAIRERTEERANRKAKEES